MAPALQEDRPLGGKVTTELYVAMILAVAAVAASMISIELGISVAIIEIVLGVVLGNTLHLAAPDWLTFLAGFGSVILTFNAGTEIDPDRLRRTWKASLLIGGVSFAAPFVCALLTCRYGLGWTWRAAEIGGIALSTTSVAVIWAVTVESSHRCRRLLSDHERAFGGHSCADCPSSNTGRRGCCLRCARIPRRHHRCDRPRRRTDPGRSPALLPVEATPTHRGAGQAGAI
jgi:sodium/hydrogen exchanger family protein